MKSSTKKKVGIILSVLAILVIVAVLIIPGLIDINRYNGLITSQLEEAMGGEVVLGHLSWGITNGFWVEADGFSVKGATAFPGDIKMSRLYARVSILPLLSRKVVVDTLRLESPVVAVSLTPSQAGEKKVGLKPDSVLPNAGDDAPAADKGRPASLPLSGDITIQKLNIKNGRIRLEDALTLPGQKMVYALTDVEIEANNLVPGQEIAFKLAMRDETEPGLGSLEGQGTFSGLTESFTIENPQLNLKATLAALDTTIIKPYLRNKPLAERMSGSISLQVNLASDLGQYLSAEGQIDLTHFTYRDPSLWKNPLPGAATKIMYQVKFDPDQVTVEKLNVQLGNLSLKAQALVQDWQKAPIVKDGVLSSDLPLVELIPLVPWGHLGKQAGTIRQTLAGGGKIIIEKLVLPELNPTKLPAEPKTLLAHIDGSIRVTDVSVRPLPELPKLEGFTGNFRLEKGVLNASNIQARMGPLTLPTLEARATNLAGKPKVSAVAKGPVRLVGTSDADVEKLLRQYGLKTFSGSAEVDLRANYDQAEPQSWDASGSLVMKGVKAVSHPAGVRLDDLKGRVTFKRKKTLDLTLENLTARVSQAPLGLEGKLSGVGSPRLTVDAKARTEQLDLKHLSALFPQLEELELGGKVDMDITIYYPQAAPAKSRLNGKVKTRGLGIRLATPDVKLKNGDADIELAGNTAQIRKMTLLANDQKVSVSGQVTNFSAPKAKLMAKSPDLNLDRLLVSLKEDPTPAKSTSKPPVKKKGVPKKGTGSKKKAAESKLPPLLCKVTAELQAEAKRGQYRGQKFQDLKFRGQYERGVLKSHELDVRMAGGHIVTKGSADFRKPKRIPFNVQPTITAVRLESIAPMLGTKKVSAHGPLSLTGQVQGRTGSTSELLGSLLGNIEGVMGPGRFYKLDPAGEAIFHLLSFINLRGILSGKMAADAASKGIPYDSLKLQASFKNGNMSVNRFNLETPALTMDGQGTVDLVYRKLNMGAHVKALGTVDGLLGLVPVVGAAAESMSDVYLNLEGPVENPRISVRPTKDPTEAEKDKPEEGAKDVDDVDKVIKGLGDVFEQILGK